MSSVSDANEEEQSPADSPGDALTRSMVTGEDTGRDADVRIDSIVDEFESLTRALVGATTVADALQHIVDTAGLVIPGADLVSVTVRAPDGAFYTPARTVAVAAELDQVQYQAGDGPCLDAASPDGPGYVASDDLNTETRWPQFSAAASGHGYGAIISTELVPAAGQGALSGALNVYSHAPHGLNRTDRHTALLFATHGALALAHAQASELADLQTAQLRQAINTRDVIGQAKGILMNRQGITADEAFELLRRTSQDLNMKLVDVARALAEREPVPDQT